MAAITLANLSTAILRRVDMENSAFAGSAELTAMINVEGAELHDLIIAAYEDHFLSSETETISSGNTIALSALTNFYKLRGVDRDEGSGEWREVQQFAFNDRNRRSTGISYRGTTVRYRLMGSSLVFTPDDAATGTYRIWFVPAYVDLVNPSDTLDYPGNWYKYVIAGVGAQLLDKEESDSRPLLTEKAAMRARLEEMAANRDAGAPIRLVRVRNRDVDDFLDDEG